MSHRLPSRDSWVWIFGIVSSAVVALASNLEMFPWLPDHVKHALSLAAFVIGVTSAKQATSGRLGRKEHQQHAEIDRAIRTINARRRRKPFGTTGE